MPFFLTLLYNMTSGRLEMNEIYQLLACDHDVIMLGKKHKYHKGKHRIFGTG
jgi:hypothetical protein